MKKTPSSTSKPQKPSKKKEVFLSVDKRTKEGKAQWWSPGKTPKKRKTIFG
jgi:hypothetical protein